MMVIRNFNLQKALILCLLSGELLSNDIVQDLTLVYNLKRILPFDGQGWYPNEAAMLKLFKNNTIKTVIEVGSWLGKSTRHMASMLPQGGMLYAVDTWNGSVEHYDIPFAAARIPTLYEQFLSNVIHAKLTDKITPVRMTSLQAAKKLESLSGKIDLIYIDATHETQDVLNDLEAWYPYVSGGRGVLCGDDWCWKNKNNEFGVRVAVQMFAYKHNLTIYSGGNFWFIKETGVFNECSFVDAKESIWKVVMND